MKKKNDQASGALKHPETTEPSPALVEDEAGDGSPANEMNFDVEEPIRDAESKDCLTYWAAFENAAKLAGEEGNEEKVRVFRMLCALCSFESHFWDKAAPFGTIRVSADLANASVEDLPVEWHPEIKRLAGLIHDPALKARLLDIHWLGVRDPASCRKAVTSYIGSARNLDHTEHWYHGVDQYQRACQLGNALGPNNQSAVDARSALETAITEHEETDENRRFSRLLKVGWEVGIDDDSRFASLAAIKAQQCFDEGDLDAAHDIWNLEANFLHSMKQMEACRAARIRAAMTIVEGARKMGTPGSFFAASHHMQKGIAALRRAGETSENIAPIKGELRAMQPEAMKEMKGFEHETDVTEEVEKIRRSFDGLSLSDSIRKLCFGQRLVQVDDLKNSTERQATQGLMQFFDGTLHADDGRVVQNQRGLYGLEGEEREKVVEQKMFASLHSIYWECRLRCFIDPARQRIGEQHRLHKADLLFLVSDNPFIPPGHEEIFLRGIHAGFHGDFLTATLFLVPQIENSIRHVLENRGVDVSNLMDDQTQPVKLLGPLFDLPETKLILGESYWFELRGLLIEKSGSEVRNRVAHGFISNPECYGPAAQNIWWIVLRLCMTPFRIEQEIDPANSGYLSKS